MCGEEFERAGDEANHMKLRTVIVLLGMVMKENGQKREKMRRRSKRIHGDPRSLIISGRM
jgi:hypothetical protein